MNSFVSEEMLKAVCEKSLLNAKEMLCDAMILHANGRVPRSYGLYRLAMEEVGKAIIGLLILVGEDYGKMTVKNLKDKVNSHNNKTYNSGALNLFIAQVLFKGNYEGAMNFIEDSIGEKNRLGKINEYKNNSFYTAIVRDDVKMPSEMITVSNLETIKFKALSRFRMANAFITVSIEYLPEIKKFQQDNPNFSADEDEYVKDFWKEILD